MPFKPLHSLVKKCHIYLLAGVNTPNDNAITLCCDP